MMDKLMVILVGVLILCVTAFSVISHEQVHYHIYRIAGVDSEITYSLPSKTTATNYIGQDLTNLELAHAQNEIVGYQITPFLVLIFILMLVQTFVLITILKVKT